MYKWRKAWSLLNLWHIQCLYSRYQHESLAWCYFKWIPYICLLRLMLRYTRCFVHCFTRSWAKNNRYLLIISWKKFELLVKLLPHNFYFWIYSGFVNWNDKSKFHYNVCFPVLQVFHVTRLILMQHGIYLVLWSSSLECKIFSLTSSFLWNLFRLYHSLE